MQDIHGDLWIPRTMWEKRRQLSAVIHRSMSTGRRLLILSCDSWTTFFGRVDVASEESIEALAKGQMEYARVSPIHSALDTGGADLSRVLGELGQRFRDQTMDLVIVDDVDLLLDFKTEDSLKASLYALVYALKARFSEIVLFTNPLRGENDIRALANAQEALTVHLPSLAHQQSVA